jgi:hypothetical protein
MSWSPKPEYGKYYEKKAQELARLRKLAKSAHFQMAIREAECRLLVCHDLFGELVRASGSYQDRVTTFLDEYLKGIHESGDVIKKDYCDRIDTMSNESMKTMLAQYGLVFTTLQIDQIDTFDLLRKTLFSYPDLFSEFACKSFFEDLCNTQDSLFAIKAVLTLLDMVIGKLNPFSEIVSCGTKIKEIILRRTTEFKAADEQMLFVEAFSLVAFYWCVFVRLMVNFLDGFNTSATPESLEEAQNNISQRVDTYERAMA